MFCSRFCHKLYKTSLYVQDFALSVFTLKELNTLHEYIDVVCINYEQND